jgi:spermidine synthase
MNPREVLGSATTPDGKSLELLREQGHYIVRVGGKSLMCSGAHGSEEAMAHVAAKVHGPAARVLVGGLGLGYTLRATLDAFPEAEVTVAELLPPLVGWNRGVLADLAGRPLEDPRVRLFEGDVRLALGQGGWDVALLDVDNGPEAFTVKQNEGLYDELGAALLARSLAPGGVAVVWSAGPSTAYERRLRGVGLRVETRLARSRGRKGGRHVLFVAVKKG